LGQFGTSGMGDKICMCMIWYASKFGGHEDKYRVVFFPMLRFFFQNGNFALGK
jgi:hypothetical protein